jgi:hypothetical protein
MRTIILALAASADPTGCVSSSGYQTRPPNYVSSQAHQAPAILNDSFGGAAHGHARPCALAMMTFGSPGGRGFAGPAPEGAGEGARFRIA